MKQNRWTKVAPFVLLLLAGVMISVVAQTVKIKLVLTKAINICMECIGIG